MNSGERSIPRDEWLEHAQVLRKLAASLVGDEHEAQDLVQETWLRANREPNREQRPQGPWLRTVLRNLVRDRSRERARRDRTERSAARDERLPSTGEMAERLDAAQRVALEVARLSEPYRTVIHLRYFEGLSPEEIARRSHAPLETVRTQLRRGLAQLRESMDRAYGGRRDAWSVALTALAWRAEPALAVKIAATSISIGGLLMSTKVLVSAAAVVIAALSLVLWQRSSPDPIADGTAPTSPAEIELQRDTPKTAALDESSAPTAVEARVAAAPPTAPPASGDGTVEVHGTVVITDENGAERKDESGVLRVATGTSEADAKFAEVRFEHGQWSTRVPRDHWIVFGALTAGGREATLPKPAPIRPEGQPIVVRGEWSKRGRLRVIDAVTKQDLSNVEVRCSERGWRANPEWTHPGDDERVKIVIEHAVSPFDLPERTRLTPYWVHAPNHAWARVDFQHKVGGMRTVELSPTASSVVVAIDGDLPEGAIVRLYPTEPIHSVAAGRAVIRLRAPDTELAHSWFAAVAVRASTTAPTRIDNLQPGEFLATVEVGEYEDQLRIGSAPVEVKAGEVANVTVPIDASLLAVPRTHLFGTVEVPEDMERGDCRLRLTRVDRGQKDFEQRLIAMSFAKESPNVLRWDAGPMRTGDYVATLTSIQHSEPIHAPGPGDTQVALVVPKLSTVTVEVVDATTGAKVAPQNLSWTRGPMKGTSSYASVPVQPNPKSGRLEFVAPRDRVEVFCRTSGYEEVSRQLELARAAEHCRLELVRATAIHLAMREDGSALNVGFTFFGAVRIRRDGSGEPVPANGTSTESEKIWYLGAPGRYTIEFPAYAGFEALEPRTVDVAAGTTVDVIVPMMRKR